MKQPHEKANGMAATSDNNAPARLSSSLIARMRASLASTLLSLCRNVAYGVAGNNIAA